MSVTKSVEEQIEFKVDGSKIKLSHWTGINSITVLSGNVADSAYQCVHIKVAELNDAIEALKQMQAEIADRSQF